MNTILNTYGELWQMIIRPPRCVYTPEDLGPRRFRLSSSSPRVYVREDLQLRNDRGQRLECSHFRPHARDPGERPSLPCVVYLHGMCSSRLEASDTLNSLLTRGLTVFCLDFAGCGMSDGEYISLGYFEEQDLGVVIRHLRQSGRVSAVGLWGRSMGAATSVLRAAADSTLAACVLDSPFSSLTGVAREMVRGLPLRFSVPECVIGALLSGIRGEVQERANFDIAELEPIREASQAKVPVLFAVATDDKVVLPHHTYDLHMAWGSAEKTLVTVGGGHNSPRPPKFLAYAAEFLRTRLTAAAAASASLEAPRRAPAPRGAPGCVAVEATGDDPVKCRGTDGVSTRRAASRAREAKSRRGIRL